MRCPYQGANFGLGDTVLARTTIIPLFSKRLAMTGCLLAFSFSKTLLVNAQDWQVEDPALNNCLMKIAKKEQWVSPPQFVEVRCHSQGVQTLKGLEAFNQIKVLSLHNNKISEFNAKLWPQLESLTITKNNLRTLELKDLPGLQKAYASGNRLESLTLINLPALEIFKANNNKLLQFHYQDLPLLEKIYLFDNELETMDIYQMPKLKYMFVRQNPMPDELYEEMDKLPGVTVLHDGNAEDWE